MRGLGTCAPERGVSALRAVGLLAALLAPLVLGACAGSAPTGPVDDRVILLAPLNIASPVAPQLEPITPILVKEMRNALAARGNVVRPLAQGEDAWRISTALARNEDPEAEETFERVASAMASGLGRKETFDVLVLPSAIVRSAEMSDRRARWDDHSQRIEYDVTGLRSRNIASTMPLEGEVPGISLHLAAFDREGREMGQVLGGLALLAKVRVDAADQDAEPQVELVSHDDPFGDRAALQERVRTLFDAVLAPADD